MPKVLQRVRTPRAESTPSVGTMVVPGDSAKGLARWSCLRFTQNATRDGLTRLRPDRCPRGPPIQKFHSGAICPLVPQLRTWNNNNTDLSPREGRGD